MVASALVVAAFAGVASAAAAATPGGHKSFGGGAPVPRATGFGSNWTVYHGNPLSSGVDRAGTNLRPMHHAWTSAALDGPLFGEPLVYGGRVVVATENDSIYELSAHSGAVLWHRHYATPVPAGDLPCGDVDPVGITGTPVIDPARREIFVVADELRSGSVQHHLLGVNLYTGDVELDQIADPPGQNPKEQLQRPGLNLSAGRVIIGYGGNDGDCENFGPYHGWIVAIPETGGAMRTYEVDAAAGESEGAVWMGGGSPLVDSAGNIWFATGNGSRTSQPYDFSDSVTELSSAVQRKQYFAPNEWGNDNATDADLGSAAPAFVNGYVFQAGKSLNGYLLNPSHLGGIGGDLAHQQVCGNDPHGGEAVVGSTVYVGCGDGVTSVTVHAGNPPTMSVNWAAANGANGPPIYASGLVWTVDGNGNLSGLDPTHGNVVVSETTNGGEDNHFPTPTVADGLMLVPTSNQVFAYDGPAGLPPSPGLPHGATRYWVATATGGVYAIGGAPALGSLHQPLHRPIVGMASTPDGRGYWLVASDGGVFAFGDAHFFGSMGGRHLNRPIVGIAGTSDGRGYWMVASDGGIFTFGDARFHGSMGGTRLAKPVVGMASQPHGPGYWLVASDGGIFAFGGAHFDGSTGGMHLVTTITGMAANPGADGGYWLVGADGGVFAFGARYQGSLGGTPPTSPVVSIASTPDGVGYWLAQRDGTVDAFGDAVPEGGAPPGASSTVAVNGSGTA